MNALYRLLEKGEKQVHRPKIILRAGKMPYIPRTLKFKRQPELDNPIYDVMFEAPRAVLAGTPFHLSILIKSTLLLRDIWAVAITVRFHESKADDDLLYLAHGLRGPDAFIKEGFNRFDRRIIISRAHSGEIYLGLAVRRNRRAGVIRFDDLCCVRYVGNGED